MKIIFSHHALERMKMRDLTQKIVVEIIENNHTGLNKSGNLVQIKVLEASKKDDASKRDY